MPGYILHYAACRTELLENREFQLGVEAPDLLKKHFKMFGIEKAKEKYERIKTLKSPEYARLEKKVLEQEDNKKRTGLHYGWSSNPDIWKFWRELSSEEKNNPFFRGYLWHLITDLVFYARLDIDRKIKEPLKRKKDDPNFKELQKEAIKNLHTDWDIINKKITDLYPEIKLTKEVEELKVVGFNSTGTLSYVEWDIVEETIEYLRKFNPLNASETEMEEIIRKIINENEGFIISKKVKNANSFAIVTHEKPDGDAISSSVAMFWNILSMKSNITKDDIDIIIPEYSKDFEFLKGFDEIKKKPSKKAYDCMIIVDCSEIARTKCYEEIAKCSKLQICIDHHEGGDINADFQVIDTKAASASMIIYDLLGAKDINSAYAIVAGILSDTQNLTFNTTDKCIEIVNKIKKENCVDIEAIKERISKKSSRTIELLKIIYLRKKEFSIKNNSIFSSKISQKDLLEEEKNLVTVNHKSIINDIQEKKSPKIIILGMENERGEWKFSLRTEIKTLDLNLLCQNLIKKENNHFIKGGGHSYSAGLTAKGDYEEILRKILKEMKSFLEK